MNLADRLTMTASEFLRWAEDLPEGRRYELVAGEPVAMSPEKNRHNLVKTDCWLALRRSVRKAGLKCAVLGDGAGVVVSETDVYEPDVTIQCGEPVDLDATAVPHPLILVEVLSPSTKSVVAYAKLLGYFGLPSVEHYLVVDPAKFVVFHHFRSGDGIGTAILREGTVSLDPPGMEFDIREFFESVASASG